MTIIACAGQICTALGDRDQTWQALCAGRSGLQSVHLDNFPAAWPVAACAVDGDFGSKARLDALLTDLLNDLPVLPPKTLVLCATTKAAPDELLDSAVEPAAQPYHLADLLKTRLGKGTEVETISAACASGTLAIIQGAMRLEAGECEAVLVIGVDLISRFVLAGFASLQALSSTGCRPFADSRDGLSLGEGAGWVLLAGEDVAKDHGFSAQARLSGWGTACDATHITAPCRHASGLIATLQQCTQQGELAVGAINAHGTGTIYNDAMELTAFAQLWSDPLPVHSVKGAIGHCLGGAGVIEAVIALDSLRHGCIPPTIGFDGAAQCPVTISGNSCQQLLSPAIITCNSGFGGINAAILFEK